MRRNSCLLMLIPALFFTSCRHHRSETEQAAVFLGQNLVVGLSRDNLSEANRRLLEKIRPAGIIMYRRNFESLDQYTALINDLQEIARRTTSHPYFIMIDEEPGGVQRLGVFGGASAKNYPDARAIEGGLTVLKELGINIILGPLADYAFNHGTFMSQRMRFSGQISNMATINRNFIAAAHAQGLRTTLKHFPGMGVFRQDPHQKIPIGRIDPNIFQESLDAFKDGIIAGTDFVMTGHGVYQNVDPNQSSTLSTTVVHGLLRDTLGFTGLIISDDISEMAYSPNSKIGKEDAAVLAIKAGHNLVMFSHHLNNTEQIARALIERMKTDSVLRKAVNDNYERVTAFKKERL